MARSVALTFTCLCRNFAWLVAVRTAALRILGFVCSRTGLYGAEKSICSRRKCDDGHFAVRCRTLLYIAVLILFELMTVVSTDGRARSQVRRPFGACAVPEDAVAWRP